MRIALDAMGSDKFPLPDVEGAVMAAREYGEEVLLIGDEKVVRPVLEKFAPGRLPIQLIHAPEMMTMQEKGLALALKAKQKEPKTSMAVGIDLVKQGQADAFVTMGNTGAAASVAFFRLGMLPGIERPALAFAWCWISGSTRISSQKTCSNSRSWARCTPKPCAG
jgi:glycerol-3-phosphate acyltransferase PlsX